MRLSIESARARWSILTALWVVLAALLFTHAWIVCEYLNIVGHLGLRGASTAGTPLQQAFPSFAADAQTWVRHALSLIEGDSLRLRWTTIDNAPYGREVHWNSAFAWLLAISGWFDSWLTGIPVRNAVERMTLWVNPALLVGLMLVFSSWAARRAGAIAGLVVAIAMAGHPRVFEGFFPSYTDHHGVLTVAVFGMVLGATFMGAGWWRPQADGDCRILPGSSQFAREAAVVSAICGGIGLWISAASVLPAIAIICASGLVTALIRGRQSLATGAFFDAMTWRTWGRVGSCVSLLCYLLEYFPNHLGFRMEANHPLYGIAWWGAAELVAELSERWVGDSQRRWSQWHRLLPYVVAICLAPLTILIGGVRVFVVLDPFLAELHRTHIQEFLPLWKTIHGMGWNTFLMVVGLENVPLVIALVVLANKRQNAPLLLWFGTLATLAFSTMAWMQSRWLLNSSGSQICLTLVLLSYFFQQRNGTLRWLASLAAAGVLFFPSAVTRITASWEDVKARRVTPKDAQSALARDVAAAIRRSQPTGDITLLTSPNSSTAVGYYGRFKTLGTLYWENSQGLKSAAAILAARSEEEAAALIRKFGVTHIAMISEENFIAPYYQLLHPNATEAEIRQCFGYQLLVHRRVPTWLEMLPYKAPDDLSSLNVSALLFKVAFNQTPADALYHIAMAKVALGSVAEAEQDFDTLIKSSPVSSQPWLRKGELLFARHDWKGSVEATLNGIARAPAEERMKLYASAAHGFYRARQYPEVIRIYRSALRQQFDPLVAAYLSFVLSTAKDDAIRDGNEALELAKQALVTDPASSTFLNAAAAALAEVGRYREAVETADRAAANSRVQGDADGLRLTEQRLAAYRAGKPWRE